MLMVAAGSRAGDVFCFSTTFGLVGVTARVDVGVFALTGDVEVAILDFTGVVGGLRVDLDDDGCGIRDIEGRKAKAVKRY